MAHINLLDWRKELRAERQRNFAYMVGAAAVVMAILLALSHLYMQQRIEHQNERNELVQAEIRAVEAKIVEIRELEQRKQQLISRMEIIERLQSHRPEIVHLFEELVLRVPEGLTLNTLKQAGDRLMLEGGAESNARVSTLMRNLDESDWFKQPNLEIITVGGSGGSVAGYDRTFRLHVPQRNPQQEAAAQEAGK